MFQDDSDINCYNLQVSTQDGVQYWAIEKFEKYYPRVARLVRDNFDKDILNFDVKGILSIHLV